METASDECAAVGNSEIDAAMFERCRIGVAFLPEDDVIRRRATHVVTEKDLRRVLRPLLEGSDPAAGVTPATG